IARNRATDYFRQARSTEELNGDEAADRSSLATCDSADFVEGLFFLEAGEPLAEGDREPPIPRFVGRTTGPENAERTGLKHGSVRVNLYRGMQMLREKLEKKEMKTQTAKES